MASNKFDDFGASTESELKRRSARIVERQRFDDKLLESNLDSSLMTLRSQNRTSSATSSSTAGSLEVDNFMSPLPEMIIENPKSTNQLRKVPLSKASIRSNSSNPFPSVLSTSKAPSSSNRNRPGKQDNLNKYFGRWKPTDDLTLIERMIQTNDAQRVHMSVKFSCKFTLKEITERWNALLYDPKINKPALSAIRNLHPAIKADIESKALFSTAEETKLASIHSNIEPTIETFQDLLIQNPEIFHCKRTAKVLLCHWELMKKHSLLSDQYLTSKDFPNYANVEDLLLNIDEQQLFQKIPDPVFDLNLNLEINNINRVFNALEEDLPLDQFPPDQSPQNQFPQNQFPQDQLPQDQVLAIPMMDADLVEFDQTTLAVLRGRMVKFLIKSRDTLIGRSSKYQHVDVDLKLEGPVSKISRRQATIRLCDSGNFIVISQGKKSLHVDGKEVLYGRRSKLNHNSVLEVAGFRFVFLINFQLVNSFKQEYNGQRNLQPSVQIVNQVPPDNQANTTVLNDKQETQERGVEEIKREILEEYRKIAKYQQELLVEKRKLLEYDEQNLDF